MGIANKKITAIFICVIVLAAAFGLSGCIKEQKDIKKVEIPLQLYYENEKYIETGDETLSPLVKIQWNGLKLPEDMSKEERNVSAYVAAVTQLGNLPENEENISTAVPKDCELNSIIVKDGTAYVDLGEGLEDKLGGSFGEGMFISQITETLVNSFEEIERVQFLVEGQTVETLAGHWDVSEPFDKAVF